MEGWMDYSRLHCASPTWQWTCHFQDVLFITNEQVPSDCVLVQYTFPRWTKSRMLWLADTKRSLLLGMFLIFQVQWPTKSYKVLSISHSLDFDLYTLITIYNHNHNYKEHCRRKVSKRIPVPAGHNKKHPKDPSTTSMRTHLLGASTSMMRAI